MEKDIPAAIRHVAESHFAIRTLLKSRLQQQWVDVDVIGQVIGKPTNRGKIDYWTWWTERFGDRFYDMGSLIRLAAGLETGLRDYFRNKRQFKNLTELRQFVANDNRWKGAVFQRIQPWHGQDGARSLLQQELGYDLETNPHLRQVRELMLHRHLYAHHAGVLDNQYLDNWQRLTGEDLRANPAVKRDYPAEDVYWFSPLKQLNDYISWANAFFQQLP